MVRRLAIDPGDIRQGDLEAVARVLGGGGLVVVPTETVYGIAAGAHLVDAVSRLSVLKSRPPGKPFPVQAASVEAAGRIADVSDPRAASLMEAFWPGPLTLVLPSRASDRLAIPASGTVGIRIPGHPFCLALLSKAGYLVMPSANLSGEPPPREAGEVSNGVLEGVDMLVDGGLSDGVESTVVEVKGEVRVLREGAISAGEIMRVAGEGAGA